MDNLSHSVVSLLAGELLHRSLPAEATPEKQATRQKLFLFGACAAGNFPDLDLLLYSRLQKPLGYLLHHRGHSHTFLYEIPQAIFLILLVWLVWPKARELMKISRRALKGFIGALAAGFVLHISMDFLNSYGVHPFYPLDSHWFYGDLVFIVEPLFWIGFGIPVAFLTKRLWVRYPFALLMLGVPMWAAFNGFIPWVSMVVLGAVAVVMAKMQSREFETGRRTLTTAFVLALAFITSQVFASQAARVMVRDRIESAEANNDFVDAAMTAAPFNPLCWSYVSVEQNKTEGVYRLRSGLVSLAPSIVSTDQCPTMLTDQTQGLVVNRSLKELSVKTGQLALLKSMTLTNCHVQAWLRFARMPLVTEAEAIDARFTRGPRGNFTALEINDFKNVACDENQIPAWIPPRANDLLKFD